MCINSRQIDTTYFLYFLLHLCDPGLNSSLVMLQSTETRSMCREARCVLTWQVGSGGLEAPVTGQPPSTALHPGRRPLTGLSPAVLGRRRPRGRGSFRKAKDRRLGGGQAAARGILAPATWRGTCHACCCWSLRCRHRSAVPGWGQRTVLAPGLATETTPKPPADSRGRFGVSAQGAGRPPHGDGGRFPQNRGPSEACSC